MFKIIILALLISAGVSAQTLDSVEYQFVNQGDIHMTYFRGDTTLFYFNDTLKMIWVMDGDTRYYYKDGTELIAREVFDGNTIYVYYLGDTLDVIITKYYSGSVPTQINDNLIIDDNLMIYPNPSEKILNFSYFTGIINKIKIYGVDGRVRIFNNINNSEAAINISSLEKGIYFINILTTNGLISKKFIKK